MSAILKQRKAAGEALVREAVEEAAVAVLRQKGLAGLTMDAVAEAAGVSKGTLYNYFKNKDDLLEAAHERCFGPLEEQLDALLAKRDAPVIQIVEAMVRAILNYVERDRPLLFVLHECPALEQTRIRHEREYVEDLAKLIQRGIKAGELRQQDPRASAWFILGLLSYVCRGPQERPELCPPVKRLPEWVTDFVLHGLAQPASKAR